MEEGSMGEDPLHGVSETYLTPPMVAKVLNVSRTKAYMLAVGGEIKASRFGNRCIRIHVDDLREYISRSQI